MIWSPEMAGAWTALALSLKVAICATLINLVLGVGAGYVLARGRFRGRNLLDAVLTLPMVMPPTVLGYYLLVLLGRRSWLGQWLENSLGIELIFTWQAAVIAAWIVSVPLVCKPARAAFEAVDRDLEDAARVSGVGGTALFCRITLPLAARGIIAGLLLAFARALGEFGAMLMVAGNIPGKTQTLSTAVYQAVQSGQDHTAAVLVAITSIVCVAVLLAAGKLAPRSPAAAAREDSL